MALRRHSLINCCLFLAAACAACAHQETETERREPRRARPTVRSIELIGTHHFDEGEIKRGLALQEPSRWWPFATHHEFDAALLPGDLERIVAFYHEHGFFDARVAGTQVVPRADGVTIIIAVDEGAPTYVATVALNGIAEVAPELQRRLAEQACRARGRIIDYTQYTATKRFIIDQLRAHGYAYATLAGEIMVDRARRTATIDLAVQPGPIVRIGRVVIEGNASIPAHPIRRELTVAPGDRYDPREVQRSEGRLYGLGVFSSVAIALPDEPQETADITVRLVPSLKLHELHLGGGVGIEQQRQEVRLRAEWTAFNFLGELRTLRASVQPAYVIIPSVTDVQRRGPALKTEVRLTQPDVLATGIAAHAAAGYDLATELGYDYHGPAGEVGVERRYLRGRLFVAGSWDLQYLTFFNINEVVFSPATTPLGLGFRTPYRLAYLQETVHLDLRDDPILPREGAYAALVLEQGLSAVGSDFRYTKLSPEGRGYIPLARRLVAAVRAEAGWLLPFTTAAEDSPITRRFYLGGPSSHRGFSYGRLAPQVLDATTDERIPVGGDAAVLFSGELRISVATLFGYPIGVVPFFDAGDVTPEPSQLRLGDLHLATGLDVQYTTPLGPLRAGIGVRLNRLGETGPGGLPNPDPGRPVALHIGIGEAF